MPKYPDEMTTPELKVAIQETRDWLKSEARHYPCGDQDAAGDWLDDLETELRNRKDT